jgi:hypothetical protein
MAMPEYVPVGDATVASPTGTYSGLTCLGDGERRFLNVFGL